MCNRLQYSMSSFGTPESSVAIQDFLGVVCSAPISIFAEQLEAARHNSSALRISNLDFTGRLSE
jgi:hypothetical protein